MQGIRRRRRAMGKRGIAAVEFAICAPFLLVLFMGTMEISMLYRTAAKLNTLAGNFAQMVATQEADSLNAAGNISSHSPVPTVTSGASPPGLSDLCAGAVYGLKPFPPNGLTIAIASVTKTGTTATSYDEWEVDLNGNCTPTGTQNIGVSGTAGALTLAVGSGSGNALVQAQGDNIIIVRATLQYPGIIGLLITSAQTLTQTALARWRYASATNVTNITATPAPSASLELSCTGTGCETNYGV